MQQYFPFLNWIKLVNRKTLRQDFIAGVTGAIVVLPQGVAFAMIAGMPPIYGLYTAMVLPIVAALFGSSFHLISGPTTAISIVVYSAVSQFADPGTSEFVAIAISVTLVAGVFQLLFGILRIGVVVNFVSHTVVIGFTAGAAILIATSQLKHFFGIDIPQGHGFISIWIAIIKNLNQTNVWVLLISGFTLVVALIAKRIHKFAPHMLIAMLSAGLLSYIIRGVEHGVSIVGELPSGLPPFNIPDINIALIQSLAPHAFAIALLGSIEAVAIARSIASKSGQRINGNQEFIGQGLSNIVGSFFSSYAGSGSFTRSGVNYTSGAVTPMAAIFAAILLMLVISFVAPLAAYLPIPAMAGIILLVSYNLIDFHHIRKIFKISKIESAVLIITIIATLTLDLEYAIYLGVFFSLIFFLIETSKPRFEVQAPSLTHKKRSFFDVEKEQLKQCPQLKILKIKGALFFGGVEYVLDQFDKLYDEGIRNILLVGDGISLIDTSGAEQLVSVVRKWEDNGRKVYFVGIGDRKMEFLNKGGFLKDIGEEHFFDLKENAIHSIYENLDQEVCKSCEIRIFKECTR